MKKPVHFQKFARNRRAERTERQGAGGISKFLFWGEDLSGSFQGAGGVGGLVAHMEKPDSAGWTAYYYHPDANGNIAAVTSPFRALAAKFSYDAFGRTTSQSGPKSGIDINALNYRFSTKPMELELATSNSTLVPPPASSGLYYYGYRFYSPNLGRWISRDPIREKGGRNLYNFVGNDGVDGVDRLGKLEIPISYDSIYQIRNNYNVIAFTGDPDTGKIARIKIEGNVNTRLSREGNKYCAEIINAEKLTINIVTIMPHKDDMLITNRGYQAMMDHELRRHEAYKKAYTKYIDPISNDGLIATRCGKICDCKEDASLKKLLYYLADNKSKAIAAFTAYQNRIQNLIGKESIDSNKIYVPSSEGYLFDGFKSIQNVTNPEEMKWKDCP